MHNIIEAKGLHKTYDDGRILALDGLDLEIKRGEFVSIVGPSGSGKSTLLHALGGLERPDMGKLVVAEHDLMREKDLTRFRARAVGFVFQLHNLLPSLSAADNVIVPMFEGPYHGKLRRKRALELLDMVGIGGKAKSRPPQLSGGERQRVAIARALANHPRVILADEPTGSLDSKNSAMVMDLLARVCKEDDRTLLVITHDLAVADRADRKITVLDGQVLEEGAPIMPGPTTHQPR